MWFPTVFDVEKLKLEIKENEKLLSNPDIYSNHSKSVELSRKIKHSSDIVNNMGVIDKKIVDIDEFLTICELEEDENLLNDVNN